MARYVDGFVLPLPKKNVAAYREISRKAGKVWREHGALEYRECVGDDLRVKGVLPFTRAARSKTGETVVFSWIVSQIARASRSRECKGDEGSSSRQDDGSEVDAV